jgi:hypothetical protein
MGSSTTNHQPIHREKLMPRLTERVDDLDAVGLSCRVTLWVEPQTGLACVPIPFVVDSGASYSMIDLRLAQQRGLLVPTADVECEIEPLTAEGKIVMRVRPGRIHAWWNPRFQGHRFDWPILFRVNAARRVAPVLGLGGIIKTCQWIFDGAYSPDSPYGCLILEDNR